MEIKELKELLSVISKVNTYEIAYQIERLEEMKNALFTYSKFKVGEIVILTIAPVINDKTNRGWNAYQDVLIKGARAKVENIDYYNGKFKYDLLFEKNDKLFTFYEEYLTSSHQREWCDCKQRISDYYTVFGERYCNDCKKPIKEVRKNGSNGKVSSFRRGNLTKELWRSHNRIASCGCE